VTVTAERLSQRHDLHGQVVILDDPARPDAVDQFLFRDQQSAALDQRQQKVKGARAQLDRLAVREQFALAHQDTKPAEFNDRFGCRWIPTLAWRCFVAAANGCVPSRRHLDLLSSRGLRTVRSRYTRCGAGPS
jgi:hypothetical protein